MEAGKSNGNGNFEALLTRCLELVEQKLNWGKGDQWSTRDFETLSERIQAETKVNLSVATLKRLWGKIKYENKPTASTLDALAQFTGFENWRAFATQHENNGAQVNGHPTRSHTEKTSQPSASRRKILAAALIPLIATAFALLRYTDPDPEVYDPGKFKFSSEKIVSKGVPNSVLFDYDATAAGPDDSIFIQQSWDKRLRSLVSREGKSHNSIYYYPGFFQAKLVVNNQVMLEHDLFIESDGWLPLVQQREVPMYFTEEEARQKGAFGLTAEKLESRYVTLQPEPPWLSYYNVRDFGGLTIGDFRFDTEVRNDYAQGTSICQLTQVLILYESNALFIPLSIKGCVSSLKISAPKLDLAALGCDLSQWTSITCQATTGKGTVTVNGNPAFEFDAPTSEKIVGLLYRFQGPGSIRKAVLSRPSGEEVYKAAF